MAIEIDLTVRGLSPVQTERMMSLLKKFLNEEQAEQASLVEEVHSKVFGQSPTVSTYVVEAELTTTNTEPAPQTAQEAAGEPEGTEWDDEPPVIAPPAPAAPEPPAGSTKQVVDETRLRSMKITELKRICEINGVELPAKATKDAIVAAIVEHCSVPAGTAAATEVAPSAEVPADDPWADESNAGPEPDPWDDDSSESDPWADETAA